MMKSLSKLFAIATLAVASLANAQVSDSTAIAGISGSAPTLDCGAGQVKVGSSCAIIFQNGVTENAACTSTGDITLGATASKLLLSCQGGVWKKAGGGVGGVGLRAVFLPHAGKTIGCGGAQAYIDADGTPYMKGANEPWGWYGWVQATSVVSTVNTGEGPMSTTYNLTPVGIMGCASFPL